VPLEGEESQASGQTCNLVPLSLAGQKTFTPARAEHLPVGKFKGSLTWFLAPSSLE
jgi:hypothetical protein